MKTYPLERSVEMRHIAHDFPAFIGGKAAQGAGFIETLVRDERRLRRRAQHQCDAVVLHQKAQYIDDRLQVVDRQKLRFIQNDDAANEVMQLATARGASGEQAFEQLHVGGDDKRCCPVFAGKPRALGFLLLIHFDIAVMFDDVFLTKNLAENGRCLFDDAGVRNRVDDAPLLVQAGMAQGKGQAGEGFPAAGRHGQGKDARRQFGLVETVLQHLGAFFVHRRVISQFADFFQSLGEAAFHFDKRH